jgi:hypothetical protein
MTTIEISGLDSVTRMLQGASQQNTYDRILDRCAQAWADETKKMPAVSAKTTGYGTKGIPVDTGRLRQSIHSRRISSIAAGVVAPVQYASFIHEGTGVMPDRPFFDWALELGGLRRMEGIVNEELSRSMNGR